MLIPADRVVHIGQLDLVWVLQDGNSYRRFVRIGKVLDNDIGLLSRQHAKIEWDGSELLITDLASKNGTSLRRWDRKKRDYQPEVEVRGVVSLRPRDEIRLADVLVITRSARNFTFESDTMINQGATSIASTVTQDPQSI